VLINGSQTKGAGGTLVVDNPATGGITAELAMASPEQATAAVDAAASAQPHWAALAQRERSDAMRAIAGAIEDDRDELATMLTLETGRPLTRNLLYVDFSAAVFRQYAELARVHGGRLAPGNEPGELSLVMRAPYGVVAGIIPWNYPLTLLVFKAAPALATGNTVVVKPSSLTPLTTLRLGELMADLLPPGVANVVVGGGGEVGRTLIEHPAVQLVAFTGSTSAGAAIGATCARLAKATHLEMGGKDPAIVFADADPEFAAHGVVWAAFLNAGQVCTSTERAYVHEAVYDEFVEHATALAAGLRVGDPMDPKTQIGPMRSAAGRDSALAQIAAAVGHGAKIAAGGDVPAGDGYFLNPTVLLDVDHSMAVMQDETFGPVLPIQKVSDADEALTLAADTPYGLGASVYTNDPALVYRAAQELTVGNLWVNDPVVDNQAAPFGGMRASGNARELGLEGLEAFTVPRHVLWNTREEIKDWWYRLEE
jgi:betaine-aldehyde dehydrogenase